MLGSQERQSLPRCMGHAARLYSKQVTKQGLVFCLHLPFYLSFFICPFPFFICNFYLRFLILFKVTEEDLARENSYDPTPTYFCKLALIRNFFICLIFFIFVCLVTDQWSGTFSFICLIFLDALASLDFKLSVSESVMFLQLAHLQVFQIIVYFSLFDSDNVPFRYS